MSDQRGHAARQFVELPTVAAVNRAGLAAGTVVPHMFAVALSSGVAGTIDLTTIGWVDPPNSQYPYSNGKGATGTYVSFLVDGIVPVYIIGGPTVASVSSGNAPASGTTGTNVAGLCWPIYPSAATGPAQANDTNRYLVRYGINHVIGYIAAGTPTLRIYRSGEYQGGYT